MQYTDVMLDIETLGTAPGSSIISIGAVAFTLDMDEADWRLFEVPVITAQSNYAARLSTDDDTMAWWREQEPAARSVYDAALNNCGAHLAWALTEFSAWYPKDARLWGNGAAFDNVLLRSVYAALDISAPWSHKNDRCYRTARRLIAFEEPAFQGVHHNALADAAHQARHLTRILERLVKA